MAELPKFVRARLQQPAAGPHPDANLLAAFVENTLTPRERAELMQHLAHCAECRAVAGFALPEPETPPVPLPADQRIWARWTMMRWVTLAASATVIAIAVLVLRPREPQMRAAFPKVTETSPAVSAAPAPPAEPALETGKEAGKSEAAGRAQDQLKKAAPAAEPKKAEEEVASRLDLEQVAPSDKEERVLAPPRVNAPAPAAVGGLQQQQRAEGPSPNQVLNQQNQRFVANVPAPAAAPMITAAGNQPPPKPAPTAVSGEVAPAPAAKTAAAKAKAAPDELFALQRARSDAVPRQALAARLEAPSFRWTIAGVGKIARSLDNGRTWDEVSVAKGVVLRAIFAEREDVWVGGAAGALYHSTDVGMHWTRVRPTSNGVELTADVARIEFTDASHGTVTTVAGDQWATSDGGKTWSVTGAR
jgi:hypothetical protein